MHFNSFSLTAILLLRRLRVNELRPSPVEISLDRFLFTTIYLGTSLVVVSVWQQLVLWHCKRCGKIPHCLATRNSRSSDLSSSPNFGSRKQTIERLSKKTACAKFFVSRLHSSLGYPMLKPFAALAIVQPQTCYCNDSFFFLGKVLRYPRDHVMHQTALIPGTVQPATDRFIRRVGRLGREWTSKTRNKAVEVLDGHREVIRLVYEPVV